MTVTTNELQRTEYCKGYQEDVDLIREREYPLLKGVSCTSTNIGVNYIVTVYHLSQILHTWTMQELPCTPSR